jgi:hypothetical protein
LLKDIEAHLKAALAWKVAIAEVGNLLGYLDQLALVHLQQLLASNASVIRCE